MRLALAPAPALGDLGALAVTVTVAVPAEASWLRVARLRVARKYGLLGGVPAKALEFAKWLLSVI